MHFINSYQLLFHHCQKGRAGRVRNPPIIVDQKSPNSVSNSLTHSLSISVSFLLSFPSLDLVIHAFSILALFRSSYP